MSAAWSKPARVASRAIPARRSTRQLETIADALRRATDHPTAEQLYRRVRAELPRVGRGTVYRNLQKLVVEDRVQVVPIAGRSSRYDGRMDRHDHFICTTCGALIDIEPSPRRVHPMPARIGGHRVEAVSVSYEGLCRACEDANGRAPQSRARRGR